MEGLLGHDQRVRRHGGHLPGSWIGYRNARVPDLADSLLTGQQESTDKLKKTGENGALPISSWPDSLPASRI